jgi:thioredoxin-like negative regulator of GroEL
MDFTVWNPRSPALDSRDLSQRLNRLSGVAVAVVHFWATWNAHDRTMDLLLQEMRVHCPRGVEFFSVNTEDPGNWTLCRDCMISNVPSIVAFVHGARVETMTGLRSREVLQTRIENWCMLGKNQKAPGND